mgnify:CR=1 FL=1
MFRKNIIYIILIIVEIIIPQEFFSINPNYGYKGESISVEIELLDIDFYNTYNSYNGYSYNSNDYIDYWNDYMSINFYNDYNDYYFFDETIFHSLYVDFESEYNEIISSNTILSYVNIPNYIENGLYSLYVALLPNDTVLLDANNVFKVILLGDTNEDDTINIQDIIVLVNIVINIFENNYLANIEELRIADIYEDGQLNVIDIVGLVNIILEQ